MKKIIYFTFCLLFLLSFQYLHAQWAKTYGGNDNERAYFMHRTSDGGYIVAGYTDSFGAGSEDIWILKLSSTGEIENQGTIGGLFSDVAYCIQETSDGGCIILADTYSYGAGDFDIWMLKLSSTGIVEQQATFGGSDTDWSWFIQETSDGGYLIAGETYSFGAGNSDVWLLKLSSTGFIEEQATFGGSDYDWPACIQETSDGGCVVAGSTYSFGAGNSDIWLLKLSSAGVIEAQGTFGGSEYDGAKSIQETSDGGCIVAGYTDSFGAGDYDIWVLKLSSTGDIEWQKTYGGSSVDIANSIKETSDGGYIVAGYTESFGAGGGDILILKLYPTGVVEEAWGFTGSLDAIAADTDVERKDTHIVSRRTEVASQETFCGFKNTEAFARLLRETPKHTLKNYSALGGISEPVPEKYARDQMSKDNSLFVNSIQRANPQNDEDRINDSIEIREELVRNRSRKTQFRNFETIKNPPRTTALNANIGQVWEPNAGEWNATAGFGGFDFWVNSSGTYIDKIKYRFSSWSCGIVTISGSVTIGGSWPISGDSFEIDNYLDPFSNDERLVIQGSFSGSDQASGTWEANMYGTLCSGSWQGSWKVQTGVIEWQRTYGGSSFDIAYSVQETSDGGYAVCGYTLSFGVGNLDILMLKLYPDGDIDESCGFIGVSDVESEETSIFGEDTYVVPEDTSVSPWDTYNFLEETDVAANLLCEAPACVLTISASSGGTTDPAPGTYTYYISDETEISVSAIADGEYRFSGWTGDVPAGHENDNPLILTMDSDKSITANFIRQCTLTIAADSHGTTSPPPGSYEHDSGASVTARATATDGDYEFNKWSGDVPSGHENYNPLTLTMDSDKSITAHFKEKQQIGNGPGGKCFIATAAYGSPLHPHIDILRQFRDRYLMSNALGRKFVSMYYTYSPHVAGFIRRHRLIRIAVRKNLVPLVAVSYFTVRFGTLNSALMMSLMFVFSISLVRFLRRRIRANRTRPER